MTQHCNNQSKAIVGITSEHPENIFTHNCPIDIQVSLVPSRGVTIKVSGDYELGHSHNLGNAIYIDLNGTRNDSYSLNLVTCNQSIGCGANSPNNKGEPYYQAQIYKNGVDTGEHFGTAGWYSVQITDVIYGSDKYQMQIFDKNQTMIYQQNFNNQPQYTVACDDECPEGYCKCECIHYPGYCCYDKNGNPLRN
jgi:hypothetical protein